MSVYFVFDSVTLSFNFFQIFEKADPANQQLYSGSHFTAIEGETRSNMLYVMFYSDYSINYRGFNISYRHIEGNSRQSKTVSNDQELAQSEPQSYP